MLRDLLKKYEESQEFINAVEALSYDYHVYNEDEGVFYEEFNLDDFEWSSGITKVTVIFDEFVLKKGFKGTVQDSDENGWLEEKDFIYKDWDINYGTQEYQIYLRAVDRGVERFFAEMEPLGSEVYAQEKCDIIADSIRVCEDITPEIKDCAIAGDEHWSLEDYDNLIADLGKHDIWDIEDHLRSGAIYWFYFNYSYDELRKIVQFLHDYDINDIHLGNIGLFWDKEQEKYVLKMFDFSGFCSNTSEILAEEKAMKALAIA